MIEAVEIYNSYPDSDLLPIDPPVLGESPWTYLHRIGEHFGDTLFLFILREAAEAGVTRLGFCRRLEKAGEDLGAVQDAITE